jgi:hypothetical protein
LTPKVAERATAFLNSRLDDAPPYAILGFAVQPGRARERYDVPEQLRFKKPAEARDAWGVHAFLEFVTATRNDAAARAHWPAIRQRMMTLVEKPYPFDPTSKRYAHDEAERLNGDLAGIYATIHFARMAKDETFAAAALKRGGELMQLRLDLERVNPRVLEPTDAATKALHHFKLARYLHLAEPMQVVLRCDQTAATRIRPFREARPGWWMAFGDRYVGGENYTTSPDFARALFIAATRLESDGASGSKAWLDVPWCKADLYFIERLALHLRSKQP